MESKIVNHPGKSSGEKTHVLIFETGDEVISTLEQYASEHVIAAGRFTGIGAFSEATLAFFDWESRRYEDIPVKQQTEVLTLAGDIALMDGKPKIHAHVILGARDGSTLGGHLQEGRVRPTLELMLVQSPGVLRRIHKPESGLALIDVTAPELAST
jgi:uncharacterized protein